MSYNRSKPNTKGVEIDVECRPYPMAHTEKKNLWLEEKYNSISLSSKETNRNH